MSVIRVGTRQSPLALIQAKEVSTLIKNSSPDSNCEIVPLDMRGDRDKITPIDQLEGSDFFTDEIHRALKLHKIDLAVHSAKDLPDKLFDGHAFYLYSQSADPSDVLVSKRGVLFFDLPLGAKIGTSSKRRKEQLIAKRPDLVLCDIRGNIQERLVLLDEGDLDGIVIAAAGLIRLGLSSRITEKLTFLKPHPLQGILAIEIRNNDAEIKMILRKLPGWKLFDGCL